MKISLKHKSLFLFLVLLLSFWPDNIISISILIPGFIIIALLDKNILKMFLNIGFIVFALIILLAPLLLELSWKQLNENSILLFRGIDLILLIHYSIKIIPNTAFYASIEKYLPEELINLLKISQTLLPGFKDKLISNFNNIKQTSKSPFDMIINIFLLVIDVAEGLSVDLARETHSKIYVISGKIHEGKSTLAWRIARKAQKKGIKTAGIIAKSINKNGKRYAYEVIDLKTNNKTLLATTIPIDDYAEHFGPYYFYKEGFEFARSALASEYLQDSSIIFLDEVGRMEIMDMGYYKELRDILRLKNKTVILIIREDFLEEIQEKYYFRASNVVYINKQQ